MKKKTKNLERYAAKLLFQFRVETRGVSNKRRTCEERLLLLKCPSATDALKDARLRGKSSQHAYRNDAGATVHFEFVGVVDLQHLGVECAEDEVWYDQTQLLEPMERKASLIPPDSQLSAIAWERTQLSRGG